MTDAMEIPKEIVQKIDNEIIEELYESAIPTTLDDLMAEYHLCVRRMEAIDRLAQHQHCCALCEFHMPYESKRRLHKEYCEVIQKVRDLNWKLARSHNINVVTAFCSPFDTRDWC
jgi:hypothetical protein